MPYDPDKRPAYIHADATTYATRCNVITPGPEDQLANGFYYKYFVAATDGDVTFVALEDDDSATRTVTLSAGQPISGRVRRVTAATATLHGWYD